VTITRIVSGALSGTAASLMPVDPKHGIHSTLAREDWIYEIRQPLPAEQGWEAEIRRAPRQSWRPGSAGPFYVVAAGSPEVALREARDFVTRHG